MDNVSPTPGPHAHPQPISVPLTDVATSDRHLLGVIILTAFASLTCLIGLRGGPPLGDHEAINALAARDALVNGHWLIPHAGGEPYVRKTPLGTWTIAAISAVARSPEEKPVTTTTARLPAAIAGIINALAVYWLGSMMFGHRAGLVSGLIAASCAATLYFARNAQADQLLATFNTLAFAFFWRGVLHGERSRQHLAAFYLCFALAMMTKAPLPLVTIGLSLVVFWFVTLPLVEASDRTPLPRSVGRRWADALGRRIRGLRRLWLLPGLALFLVVAGAWPLYIYLTVPDATELWRIEYFDRYSGALSDKNWPFWYYLPCAFGLTFPFLASLPEAAASAFLPRYSTIRRGLSYVLTWGLVTTVFLSTASFKRPHYLLSAVPAFCLLLGPVVDRIFFGTLLASKRLVNALCLTLPLICGGIWAAGTWYLQKDFPAVARGASIALGAGAILWVASCLAYYAGLRRSSFGFLLLSIPAMLALAAPSLGRLSTNREAEALSKALLEHQIDPQSDVIWTDSRPNSAVEFSTGIPLKRVLGLVETAALREGREFVSPELQQEIVERIVERLGDPKPAYFIMSKRNYDAMVAARTIPHRIAFEVPGPSPRKSLVVFTQDGGV